MGLGFRVWGLGFRVKGLGFRACTWRFTGWQVGELCRTADSGYLEPYVEVPMMNLQVQVLGVSDSRVEDLGLSYRV